LRMPLLPTPAAPAGRNSALEHANSGPSEPALGLRDIVMDKCLRAAFEASSITILPIPRCASAAQHTHGSPFTARDLGLAPRQSSQAGDLNAAKVRAQTSERNASTSHLLRNLLLFHPSTLQCPPHGIASHKVSLPPRSCPLEVPSPSHLPHSRVPAPSSSNSFFSLLTSASQPAPTHRPHRQHGVRDPEPRLTPLCTQTPRK
jgi:hypothetical protein